MSLDVDLTDTRRRIVTVRERLPVQQAGDTVLLYPQWEAASHAPSVSAHRLAGLTIKADGQLLRWTRDPAQVHAVRVHVPRGAASLELDFQYLAPLGREPTATLMPGFVGLSWNRVLLYPAGWAAHRLPVQASARLPEGMSPATGLQATQAGSLLRFAPTTLDRLIDTPLFAASHVSTREVVAAPAPVRAHWLAAQATMLEHAPALDERLGTVVRETEAVFGPAPFERYDFLFGLDDRLPGPGGIEHAASSEVFLPADFLGHVEDAAPYIDVIPHELIHAWNGAWRVPADMAAATPGDPLAGTLLWVYEGQTEFWSRVIAARAGLRSVQQTLDALAIDAATVEHRAGRRWKSLADSGNDPLLQGSPVYWRDWQRREDYYVEGVLFWLDVDARLRRCSAGAKGLDDFARLFFSTAGRQPGERQRRYTQRDVASALAHVCTGAWEALLRDKLDSHDDAGVLDGLALHGWRLAYRDTPSTFFRQSETSDGILNLTWSLGLTVTPAGQVKSVAWDGPAFRAGIIPGARLKRVDSEPFSADVLLRSITARGILRLIVMQDGQEDAVEIDAAAGPRYPVLERIDGVQDTLSRLLAPRTAR